MLGDNTDKSWQSLGEKDPYYAVLTCDKFRRDRLDEKTKEEFFQTGKKHVSNLINRIESQLGEIPRGRALDFGCGVGRLVFPLSEARFSSVIGVDVSEAMLLEAKRNAEKVNKCNVTFSSYDSFLNNDKGTFDFIHSYIVFQHIPVRKGEMIIAELLNKLSSGGIAALHMPFARKVWSIRKIMNYIRIHVRPLHIIGNLLQRRPWSEPPIQMNLYDLNRILKGIQMAGFSSVMLDFVEDGSNVGAYLIFRKADSLD